MTPCVPSEERPAGRRWKHGKIPVIGVIGGIGGGKTRFTGLLAARGAMAFLADSVGHELLADRAVCARVVARFGSDVLAAETGSSIGASPRVDRGALGKIVFADRSARDDLEAILHPLMRRRFEELIDRASRIGGPPPLCIVLDAAILLEAGWDDLCDLIVFVDAPRDVRLRRVALERGWSETTLDARERAQWPEDRKRRRADLVITNDAGLDHLNGEIERLVKLFDETPARLPSAATADHRREHAV